MAIQKKSSRMAKKERILKDLTKACFELKLHFENRTDRRKESTKSFEA
jgi:hypothetical protein